MQYHRIVRGKRLLAGGILLILALGAGGMYVVWKRRQPPQKAEVVTAPAAARVGPYVDLPGKIEAAEVYNVPVPVEGRIESMRVGVGQEVYEGQVLAQIRSAGLEAERDSRQMELNRLRTRLGTLESRTIELNLKAAQAKEEAARVHAEMDAAQKELLRRQAQFKEGAIRRLDLEQAQQAFQTASVRFEGLDKVAKIAEGRAADSSRELDLLRSELAEKTKAYEQAVEQVASGEVVSPVDGLVIAVHGGAGQDVTYEIEDLFQIATNLGTMRVVVEPPPPVLGRIQAGAEAVIQIAELADGVVGKVSEVDEGRVYIEFANPNPALVKPGMTVHVLIKVN